MSELMEPWRKVWRQGVGPLLTVDQLEVCLEALVNDDSRLMQGGTTTPPPLHWMRDWPVEAACLLGICGVVEHGGWGQAHVGETEETFAKLCYFCDQETGEWASIRHLLNFVDESPRDEMRAALIPEVQRSLGLRKGW